MNCVPCQKKLHSKPPTPQPKPCPEPKQDKFCYGEGEIATEDECGTKLHFRLITDPNADILQCRIEEIEAKLLNWLQRASPVTDLDMRSLNIFCFNSSLLGLQNSAATGLTVGEDAAGEFLKLFNVFKSKFSYITPDVTTRLVNPDVVAINMVFKATQFAGPISLANPVVGRFVFTGQFHIIDFGNELCVDSSTAWVSYPVV